MQGEAAALAAGQGDRATHRDSLKGPGGKVHRHWRPAGSHLRGHGRWASTPAAASTVSPEVEGALAVSATAVGLSLTSLTVTVRVAVSVSLPSNRV